MLVYVQLGPVTYLTHLLFFIDIIFFYEIDVPSVANSPVNNFAFTLQLRIILTYIYFKQNLNINYKSIKKLQTVKR